MQGDQWPIVDDQVAIASLDDPITNREVKYANDNQVNHKKWQVVMRSVQECYILSLQYG